MLSLELELGVEEVDSLEDISDEDEEIEEESPPVEPHPAKERANTPNNKNTFLAFFILLPI